MGAWDCGIFDDDTAYDFTDEIKADPKGFFRTSFSQAIKSASPLAPSVQHSTCPAEAIDAAAIGPPLPLESLAKGLAKRGATKREAPGFHRGPLVARVGFEPTTFGL